jgi:hypothetical protein
MTLDSFDSPSGSFGNWKIPRNYYAPQLPVISSRTPRCSEPYTSSGQNIVIGEDRYVRLETIHCIEPNGSRSDAWVTLKSGYKIRAEKPLEDILSQIESFRHTLIKQGQTFVVQSASVSQPNHTPIEP